VRPVPLGQLEAAVRASWDEGTSDTPDRYDPANPERDQCGPTSLVVHDYLGGELLHVEVFTAGVLTDHHYWNRLPTGDEVDLTRGQFVRGETFGPVDAMERPTVVSEPAQRRYDLLRSRVAAALASVG
jgi:hypothetical protein